MDDLHRSPLHDRHVALGAKFARLRRLGDAAVPTPRHRRRAPGGPHRRRRLRREPPRQGLGSPAGGPASSSTPSLTNDLVRIEPGQAQYTLCCTEIGRGRRRPDRLRAQRRRRLPGPERREHRRGGAAARRRRARPGSRSRDQHRALRRARRAGPAVARRCSPQLGLPTDHAYMSLRARRVAGQAGDRLPLRLHRRARLRAAAAVGRRRRAVGRAGRGRGGAVRARRARHVAHRDGLSAARAGPVARDQPGAARLGWAVGWDKPDFWGREALLPRARDGPRRRLWGLQASRPRRSRGPTWRCCPGTASPVGTVTSGTFSPTLGTGIALALLDRGVSEGDVVNVDVRGRPAAMQVVRPPFVEVDTR